MTPADEQQLQEIIISHEESLELLTKALSRLTEITRTTDARIRNLEQPPAKNTRHQAAKLHWPWKRTAT
jgi:hypothetical protein